MNSAIKDTCYSYNCILWVEVVVAPLVVQHYFGSFMCQSKHSYHLEYHFQHKTAPKNTIAGLRYDL